MQITGSCVLFAPVRTRAVPLRRRCRQRQAATGAIANSSAVEPPAYPYNDADGKRQKATIEHIFKPTDDEPASQPEPSTSGQAPWMMGWQMNERNVYFTDNFKVRLIKRVASDELGISDEEMESRLQQLGALLPGLESRLGKAPPKLVARLAANTGQVAVRLLALKELFPQANLSAMVNNRLGLLLDDDTAQLQAAATRLRQLLPDINVDKFVETFPLVLDVECFEMALEDAKRIMPGINVTSMLRNNPDVILSLVKGKNLIPYDQISNPWA